MMKAPPIPTPELASLLRSELLPGEHLLWSGSPALHKQLHAFWIWLFGIPWTAFSLYFGGLVLMSAFGTLQRAPSGGDWGMGILFSLFLLPFVAVGFVMLWVPFETLRKARRTIFGLTNRRMLSVTAGTKRECTSVMLQQMGPIDVQVGSKGYGNVRIQTGTGLDSDGDQTINRFELLGVPDVSRLKGLLLGQLSLAR
jgi:hypothetical protein